MRRISLARLSRAEKLAGLNEPRRCEACGCWPGWNLSTSRYVDPDTREPYDDPAVPDPCEVYGHGPFVVVTCPLVPDWKRPGAPVGDAVDMTELEAADYHAAHGKPDLAAWLYARAGVAPYPTTPPNVPLSEYEEPTN